MRQYVAKHLGADVVILGYLNTMFSFIMLCGGPLYGRFGDVFGRRAALTLSCSATVLSYGILSLANSVPMLFLFRLSMGFMHTLPGLQMVITDTSDETGRANALGKLGLAFSLGIMAGPLLGGSLAEQFGNHMVAFTASAVSLLSVVMVLVFLPKNTKSGNKEESYSEQRDQSGLSKTIELLRLPTVMNLLMIRLAAFLPATLFQTMGAVITMDDFKLGPQENGVLMAVVGAASAVVQGLGIGILTERFSEPSLLTLSFSISGGAYVLMYLFQTTFGYFVSQILLTAGFSLLQTILTSMMTKAVSTQDTGLALGIAATCDSLLRTITPPLGTFMYLRYGWPSLATLGSAVNFGMVVILLFKGQN